MIKNWKTSLAGSGAIGVALINIAYQITSKNYDAQSIFASIGVLFAGVTGLFAKDSNVTGGTVPQTAEAEARVDSAPL
jgi:hypothetical protein